MSGVLESGASQAGIECQKVGADGIFALVLRIQEISFFGFQLLADCGIVGQNLLLRARVN